MNYTFKSFSVMSKIYLANLGKSRKMKCYYDMDPNSDDSDDPDWVPSKNKAQCNNSHLHEMQKEIGDKRHSNRR